MTKWIEDFINMEEVAERAAKDNQAAADIDAELSEIYDTLKALKENS